MSFEYEPKKYTRLKTEHEQKARVCKECKNKVAWIYLKYCGKKHLYVNENGKRWNSNICPDCARMKYSTAYQKKRIRKKKFRDANKKDDIEELLKMDIE